MIFQIVTRISRTPRVRVNPPGSHRPVGGRLERDGGKVSVGREEIGDFGLDLAMAFATPEGDIGIAMTLAPDARERLDQMHVLKMFTKSVSGLIVAGAISAGAQGERLNSASLCRKRP